MTTSLSSSKQAWWDSDSHKLSFHVYVHIYITDIPNLSHIAWYRQRYIIIRCIRLQGKEEKKYVLENQDKNRFAMKTDWSIDGIAKTAERKEERQSKCSMKLRAKDFCEEKNLYISLQVFFFYFIFYFCWFLVQSTRLDCQQ